MAIHPGTPACKICGPDVPVIGPDQDGEFLCLKHHGYIDDHGQPVPLHPSIIEDILRPDEGLEFDEHSPVLDIPDQFSMDDNSSLPAHRIQIVLGLNPETMAFLVPLAAPLSEILNRYVGTLPPPPPPLKIPEISVNWREDTFLEDETNFTQIDISTTGFEPETIRISWKDGDLIIGAEGDEDVRKIPTPPDFRLVDWQVDNTVLQVLWTGGGV